MTEFQTGAALKSEPDFIIQEDVRQEIGVWLRPGAMDFLKYIHESGHELVLYSNSKQALVTEMMNKIDPYSELFDAALSEKWGFPLNMPQYGLKGRVKLINNLGRDLKRTILIDDHPISGFSAPDNTIILPEFQDETRSPDRELAKAQEFLEKKLEKSKDVREVIKKSYPFPARVPSDAIFFPNTELFYDMEESREKIINDELADYNYKPENELWPDYEELVGDVPNTEPSWSEAIFEASVDQSGSLDLGLSEVEKYKRNPKPFEPATDEPLAERPINPYLPNEEAKKEHAKKYNIIEDGWETHYNTATGEPLEPDHITRRSLAEWVRKAVYDFRNGTGEGYVTEIYSYFAEKQKFIDANGITKIDDPKLQQFYDQHSDFPYVDLTKERLAYLNENGLESLENSEGFMWFLGSDKNKRLWTAGKKSQVDALRIGDSVVADREFAIEMAEMGKQFEFETFNDQPWQVNRSHYRGLLLAQNNLNGDIKHYVP